jgi:hypothetical protein
MTPSHHEPGTAPSGGNNGLCYDFRADLASYVDGELRGADLDKFESHLAECTECVREVAIFRSLKGELQEMGVENKEIPGGTVWGGVNRRITRPAGWIFLVIGIVMYLAYAVYTFIQSPMDLFEKLATGFVVIGFIVLLASVAYERIRSFRTDPYKGVEK